MNSLFLLLVVAGVAVAAPLTELTDLPPLPTYHIHRAPRPIAIDGRIDPAEWQAAETVELTSWWPKQTGLRQKTTVRLLWDDVFLYVSYDCVDQDITAHYQNRDDPTYKDDCCEIFIAPHPGKPSTYFGFEMNARAVMYDYVYAYAAGTLFRRWDLPYYQLMTGLDGTLNMRGDVDRGWQLEVAIPFSGLDDLTDVPKPGKIWKAQICRWDGTEPDRVLSLWCHSGRKSPDPHNWERFGSLVFDGPK